LNRWSTALGIIPISSSEFSSNPVPIVYVLPDPVYKINITWYSIRSPNIYICLRCTWTIDWFPRDKEVGWLVGLWCLMPLSKIFQLYCSSQGIRKFRLQSQISRKHVPVFVD
jgi:hypothetical protein